MKRMKGAPLVLAALLLLIPALSGCLDEAPAEPVASNAPAEAAIPAPASGLPVTYACPPGGRERSDGLCTGTLESPTETLQEPHVAMHPGRPEVLALGTNTGPAGGTPDTTGSSVQTITVEVHVTEDGGATWRRVEVPHPAEAGEAGALRVHSSSDPLVLFGPDGTLHVVGMATARFVTMLADMAVNDRVDFRIFHTRSHDLGRTWSEPTLLAADGDNDRPWIGLGPDGLLVVAWQNTQHSVEAAWSRDAGATWTGQEPADVAEGCIQASRPVFVNATPVVACAALDGSGPRLLDLDPESGRWIERSRLGLRDSWWPHLASSASGNLLLAVEQHDGGIALTRSDDNGRTWDAARSLEAVTGVADGWQWVRPMALDADPWGGFHLLLKGPRAAADMAAKEFDGIAHVVLDGETLEELGHRLLSPEAYAERKRLPPYPAAIGDDFYGMAFGPDHGFLVWTRDTVIDYTHVLPGAEEDAP